LTTRRSIQYRIDTSPYGSSHRLANTAHTARPWRIHQLAPDFRIEDVWELPCSGGPQDFPRLVAMIAKQDPSRSSSHAARTLFAIRGKLGEALGWDGTDKPMPSLRERLPVDLRNSPRPAFDALPFTSLYLHDDEFAAEVANRTMHGVLHLSWVPDELGGFRGQMAVLVKPNGALGGSYMQAIRPFRHLIVYPALIGQLGRAWRKQSGARVEPVTGG
jgi:Protein of unknown function (DUF2867)